jgi:5-formyltetrahydrofolate cyclo-ligase
MTAQAGDTTSSLALRKAALRKALRQHRRALSPAQRRREAARAAAHLARACRAWNARDIAVYLSLPEEIDTAPLLRALRRGCRLYVPVLAPGPRLRLVRWRDGAPLRANRYGIPEPAVRQRAARLDLVVLPLVAFDAAGRRLGMGGGYYDRLLARRRPFRRPLCVGLAFAGQEVPAVPAGPLDARLDAVATARGLRRFPA